MYNDICLTYRILLARYRNIEQLHGYVAQGIEQPPSKRSVVGSNPTVPVILPAHFAPQLLKGKVYTV